MQSDADAADPILRFQVLGPLQVWRSSQEIEPGPPQQRALLAVLLRRAGRPIGLQELVEGIWGEEPPPNAVAAVRTYVSRLRGLLEPDRKSRAAASLLVSVADGYTLRLPAQAVDAARFEQHITDAGQARAAGDAVACQQEAAAALGLWRAAPLAGLPGPSVETWRRRLDELRSTALELRLGAVIDLGGHREAVAELADLVAEQPLSERFRALLMLALYRSGRQAEALAAYADTRRLLVNELGVEPGPELTDLHARILASDASLVVPERTAGGAVMPSVRVLAQLPQDPTDFTGRAELTAELRLALCDDPGLGVRICALAGIGGVGKTALAVHAAHSVRSEFADGQLYVDLRGAGDGPVDPEAVLGDFLAALGEDTGSIPEGLERRSLLYRSLLAERRVLVVLDNARDTDQVMPLLPGGAGCAVLVTSRARLTDLPGARHVDLDVLDPQEALQLFGAIAGPERAAAEREAALDVVSACSFLPLAVRIVASRLAARRSWTVSTLAARLADEQRRLDELQTGRLAVEATFELGYRQLSPALARAFRLLALPDSPHLSLASAAAVLGLPQPDAEELAESLVDAGLLESPAPGRYRHHDLLRLFARRQSERADSAEERDQAVNQLLDFLFATVSTASRILEPGDVLTDHLRPPRAESVPLTDTTAARAWLRAEQSTLFAVIAQRARDEREAAVRPLIDLLMAWVWLIDGAVHQRQIEQILRPVVVTAHRIGDAVAESRARCIRGLLLYAVDEYEAAEAELLAALLPARANGDAVAQFTAANLLGMVAGTTGRAAEALPFLQEAFEQCEALGNASVSAIILGNTARSLSDLGREHEALATAEAAVETARRSGNQSTVADTHYQSSVVLREAGRADAAATHLGDALRLFREQGRRTWEGLALARLAECLEDEGREADAALSAEQALVVAREVGDAFCEGLALAVGGRVLTRLGETDRGRTQLEDAYAVFQRLGLPEAEELRAQLDAAADRATSGAEPGRITPGR
ncbi:AfsR/SARP family transcriptional regulator [Peterkaempfera bronchialis]|uniref:AfsR family transcriptional regulator n=1 Tax=Peterkaempfera bronchialis TaxID=2126346 RepID=A0A345T460_9ACTN|nr:AfsR/SARP family transcriptional regulator [Peterkaempfera bronchialis]AXI80765.1 AfsR family transcriptional regulator [Peterkaempfera bronchialis]